MGRARSGSSHRAEVIAEDGEDYEGEDAELADILAAGETAQERAIREATNVGQSAIDDQVVSLTRARAVQEMAARGVVISDAQQQSAIKIFPKVSRNSVFIPKSIHSVLLFCPADQRSCRQGSGFRPSSACMGEDRRGASAESQIRCWNQVPCPSKHDTLGL